MKIIYDFCKHAERVFGSTTNIMSLKDLKVLIDITKDEIWRTRYDTDGSCIFDFSLGFKSGTTLKEEVDYMRTIELFYPNKFSWRYNGKHIEAVAIIPMKEKNLGIFSRYNGIFNFIKQLRKQLATILKYREYFDASFTRYIDHKILATGSLNVNTQLYVIDILPWHDQYNIVKLSNDRTIYNPIPKELDMKYWVREMNPDFFKEYKQHKIKKYPLTDVIFGKYPPCIKKIANLKRKGNYNRFLLSTFLLGIHNQRDAKHQLDVMLTDEERAHINSGNCKDQWRAILAKNYTPPSCKTMIECGHCPYDCGKPAPIILDINNENE